MQRDVSDIADAFHAFGGRVKAARGKVAETGDEMRRSLASVSSEFPGFFASVLGRIKLQSRPLFDLISE